MREPETGELSHRMAVRIRIDKSVGVGIKPEFTPVANRWVKVEPLGTAIYTGAQQTGNVITHRLYCKFVSGLDTSHEFVDRGRVFRVKRATAMRGRSIWSVIEVEELGPDGPPANEGGGDEQFGFR